MTIDPTTIEPAGLDPAAHARPSGRCPRLLALLAGAAALALVALPPAAASTAPALPVLDRTQVKQLIIEEALNSRVPPALALALAKVESDFQTNALSSAGARGVMQIMPQTAAGEFGVGADELWDPRLNIQLGLDFLGTLHERYGRWDLALSHYNSGRIEGAGKAARPHPLTEKYVAAVALWQQRYEAQSDVWQALAERERTFWPARTRHAAAPADPGPDLVAAPPQTAFARPAIAAVDLAAMDEIERRIHRNAARLDDFSQGDPRIRNLGW